MTEGMRQCLDLRALHWVTIQMLCVPIDEEIPEVSDKVVNAITGQCGRLNLQQVIEILNLNSIKYFCLRHH